MSHYLEHNNTLQFFIQSTHSNHETRLANWQLITAAHFFVSRDGKVVYKENAFLENIVFVFNNINFTSNKIDHGLTFLVQSIIFWLPH